MILTNTKLILTDFLIQINIYHYWTVTYQYLVNSYTVKQYLTGPDQYLNDSYGLVILKTGLTWIRNNAIEIHNPY